jgi:hypothetical protein
MSTEQRDNVLRFPKPTTTTEAFLATTTDPFVKFARSVDDGWWYISISDNAGLRFDNLQELVRFIEELTAVATIWNERNHGA